MEGDAGRVDAKRFAIAEESTEERRRKVRKKVRTLRQLPRRLVVPAGVGPWSRFARSEPSPQRREQIPF